MKPVIERLEQTRSNHPKYEVFAPTGYRFEEGCHSFIAWDMAEARKYTAYPIEKCPADCDCEEG